MAFQDFHTEWRFHSAVLVHFSSTWSMRTILCFVLVSTQHPNQWHLSLMPNNLNCFSLTLPTCFITNFNSHLVSVSAFTHTQYCFCSTNQTTSSYCSMLTKTSVCALTDSSPCVIHGQVRSHLRAHWPLLSRCLRSETGRGHMSRSRRWTLMTTGGSPSKRWRWGLHWFSLH